MQYAYTGGYGAERHRREVLSAEPHPSPFQRGGTRNLSPWDKFKRTVSKLRVSDEEPYLSTPFRERVHRNIFLSHAKVFVFADFWRVTRLKELSLQKLGKCLEEVKLTGEMVEEVAALLEYCYDEPRPEELTALLMQYSACMIDKLLKSERFRRVFSRHGELALSLVGAMVETA